ncbi:hypothetical protein [Candidatus Amarobacter glycogenicus]|uniref:hypothetical protein n=1 Tax=Candidatus Amarobacter glycogenicus TaxID=3140699 RepID=UPI003135DA3F|nr:hypothetical protein [Dehalococcoidia bacterium]
MRTTIEIDEAKLVKLKKMAAERGERGFSVLIDETLKRHLGMPPQAISRRTGVERSSPEWRM